MLPLPASNKVQNLNVTANSPVKKKKQASQSFSLFSWVSSTAAFFSSVHLSSRCPITSEPGLLNATQTDSQEACLLNRVLATSYPRNCRFLAAQEEWRKHCRFMLWRFSLPDFSIFLCTRPIKKKKGGFF